MGDKRVSKWDNKKIGSREELVLFTHLQVDLQAYFQEDQAAEQVVDLEVVVEVPWY